jgi:hypothetical protein
LGQLALPKLPTPERITEDVLLVNHAGEVLWRAEGRLTEEKWQDLKHSLESQHIVEQAESGLCRSIAPY